MVRSAMVEGCLVMDNGWGIRRTIGLSRRLQAISEARYSSIWVDAAASGVHVGASRRRRSAYQ